MPTIFKSSIAALALSLSLFSAQAAPVTHQVTAIFDGQPVVQFDNNSPLRTQDYRLSFYQAEQYSGFPFTFVDGDTIEMTFNFTNGGITLADKGFGEPENFLIPSLSIDPDFDFGIDNPDFNEVMSYDVNSTITIGNFTGDLTSNTFNRSFTDFPSVAPRFSTSFRDNITDSTVTISEMTISSTFTNIMYLPGFEQYSSFQTISAPNGFLITFDEVAPLPVPLPGALALIGVGLFGVFSLRRKQTTQKDGDAP